MALPQQELPDKSPLDSNPGPDENYPPLTDAGPGPIDASTVARDEPLMVRDHQSYLQSPLGSVSTAVERRESEAFLSPGLDTEGKVHSKGREDSFTWRLLRQPAKVIWNDWWIRELVASVIAASIMAALLGLLYQHQNKPAAQWPLLSKPTTSVAICSNIISALILFIVAESIGQYKWYFFRQRCALNTMELFDGASRGIAGSALVLVSKQKW
jgi:hypothetical protein